MWYILWNFPPLKERWCPHHVLRLFFAGRVWNSSMASWACSMSDSFTQETSIGWYPFHLTRYSRSRPLSCLDLSTTSTSNSGSLWTKSGGGLEWCSRLGLEASRETGFKRETWNAGWTLRFPEVLTSKCQKVSFPTLWMAPHMGPRTYDLNLPAT